MDWLAHPFLLSALLAVGGLGAAVLVALGLVALTRRRTRAYALVALALVTLLARAVVGAFAMADAVPVDAHHVAEHVLDAATAGLVLAAVYHARHPRGAVAADGGEPNGGEQG